ncbi:MAG: hypothetical protein ABI947_05310 [Chloroflexota bacterium]
MTPDQLQTGAPLIAAGLFVMALVLFLFSLYYFRRSRTDAYWRRRRNAGQRGWRILVWSVILIIGSGAICGTVGLAGLISPRPAPIAEALLATNTLLPISTFTPPSNSTATTQPILPSTATRTSSPVSTKLTVTKTPTLITNSPTIQSPTSHPTRVIVQSATPTIFQSVILPTTQIPTYTATHTIEAKLPVVNTPVATEAATAAVSDQAVATTPIRAATTVPAVATLPATQALSTTLTFTPTETDTITLTAPPLQSDTPTITPTPSETLLPEPTTAIPPESSVTPNANFKLAITALDVQISPDYGPVAPTDSFKAGFNRIYYFINFSGMQHGVLWRRQLLLNNRVIEDNSYLWGQLQDGTAYFFFGREGGFQPGNYQLRIFVGQSDKPVAAANFTVK